MMMAGDGDALIREPLKERTQRPEGGEKDGRNVMTQRTAKADQDGDGDEVEKGAARSEEEDDDGDAEAKKKISIKPKTRYGGDQRLEQLMKLARRTKARGRRY
jgi:hypothetical protein